MLFCFRMRIKESTKCSRLSQQLDRAITTVFKPVANHNFNVSWEKESGSRPYCELLWTVLVFRLIFRLCMRRRRSQRGRWWGQSGRWCWICSSLPLKSTSITTLRSWWTSPSSLWWAACTHKATGMQWSTLNDPKHTSPLKCEQFAHCSTIAPSFMAKRLCQHACARTLTWWIDTAERICSSSRRRAMCRCWWDLEVLLSLSLITSDYITTGWVGVKRSNTLHTITSLLKHLANTQINWTKVTGMSIMSLEKHQGYLSQNGNRHFSSTAAPAGKTWLLHLSCDFWCPSRLSSLRRWDTTSM